jgi:2-dehydropantoate 2-reductase
MKILFYGSGPLASLLASRLLAGGQDVTLLARGQRLQDLRLNGLVLCDLITGDCSHSEVRLVESLEPQDAYDLVVVLMGAHYLPDLLPVLAANQACPNLLFMGNNAAGPDGLAAAVGQERLLMGFFGAAGTLDDGVAFYADRIGRSGARLMVGDPYLGVTPRLQEVAKTLEASGFPVERHANIDAYLKTHAAAVLPMACAYYLAGQSIDRLAATPDAQVLMLRGMKEAVQVLRALRIPVIPPRIDRTMRLPEPLMVGIMRRRMSASGVRLGVIHMPHMGPEIGILAGQYRELIHRSQLATPNLDRLLAALSPSVPPIPEGSAGLKLDWRGVYAGLAALSALTALLFGLNRRRKSKPPRAPRAPRIK